MKCKTAPPENDIFTKPTRFTPSGVNPLPTATPDRPTPSGAQSRSSASADGHGAPTSRREQRKVIAATTIGTAIEWYDYFLYAAVAGLVFNKTMFGGLDADVATIVSFLTVGISFLFRPLGAMMAGYFSDRLGRRLVLMITLIAMGGATALIGLLPTYASIGAWAPILLIVLRVIQGFSAGGEWGSAVLLAVEHAPTHRRGFFGAGPQVGVPLGLLLSSGVLAIMDKVCLLYTSPSPRD